MVDTLIAVREYLATPYHPDVDCVDGVIEGRNVGEREHGELQLRNCNPAQAKPNSVPVHRDLTESFGDPLPRSRFVRLRKKAY